MILSKKNLLLLSLIVGNVQTMQASNIKTVAVLSAIALSADARTYHVRNASPDKTIVLGYTCPDHTKSASMIVPVESLISSLFSVSSSKKSSQNVQTEIKYDVILSPGDRTTISKCSSIDSMTAAVQIGEYPFNYNDPDYYTASPTYNTLNKYRTFKLKAADCKDGHWCNEFGYTSTSVFSRDFGIEAGEAGWSNSTQKKLMDEIKVAGYLRGTK